MDITQNNMLLRKKQSGATLFISLVFLTLMTVVTVSGAQIASLDSVIAGNNTQQMLAYQQTAKTLELINNPVTVIQSIVDNDGVFNDWRMIVPSYEDSTKNATRTISSRTISYGCQDSGVATRVGASCTLIDLSSEDMLFATGIKDRHFRGVGKAIPTNPGYTN